MARELNGDIPRIVYQLARAFDKLENPIALELMDHAAWDLEYPAAFYHLGTFHEDGLYTPPNLQKARRAFLEGWTYENIPATYALGRINFENAQTDGEQKAAMDLLFKTANIRSPYALEYVGNMLYNGEVAGGNPTNALTYLKAASEKKPSQLQLSHLQNVQRR